jgi:predicted MFS family arabinose efflux permease
LTYGVIEGPHAGWTSLLVKGSFVMSLLALVAFLIYEPRRTDPLLDLRFFRSIPFSSASVIAVCSFASFAGFLFLNTLYLQKTRGLSALDTGLCTLPLAIATMLGAPLSGRLVARFGTRFSFLLAGAGFLTSALLLTRLATDTSFITLLLTYVLLGAGFGLVNIPITHTAVSGMPKAQAGVAAAVASTSRQVGASLGVAVAGTVVGTSYASGLGFAQATHPVWWIVATCGAIIGLLGWLSNTPSAKASMLSVAHLLSEPA